MDFLKLFLMVLIFYFIVNIVIGYRRVMKQQKEQFEEMLMQKEKYKQIDSTLFDEIEDEELKMAIVYHIWNKEDEDLDGYFEQLSYEEKIVYTQFLVSVAIDNGRTSFVNFYTEANQKFVPYLIESHSNILGADEEVMTLLNDLQAYHQSVIDGTEPSMVDMDIDLEADELEELPSYDLYTLDYLDKVDSTELEGKIVEYIRKNKEGFID